MIAKFKNYLAERRAAADVAKLFSGAVSRQEEQHMSGWSLQESSYSQTFLETAQLISKVEALQDDPLLMSVVAEESSCERTKANTGPSRRVWIGYSLAATVLLAIMAGFLVVNEPEAAKKHNILRYVTRVGEQKTVDLADGSQVVLNTATELLVDLSKQQRRLVLQRGEVFFDVAKDSRPFTVQIDGQSVTALGTAFNIQRVPESFTLAVTEGEVSVHRREEVIEPSALLLNAPEGEQLLLNSPGQVRIQAGTVVDYALLDDQLMAHTPKDMANFQSWRSGIIRFDSVPLYKVVKELNRYSAKKLLIEDDAIMNLELYATVHLDHMTEALNTFELALPVKVMHRFDRIIIVGRDL